MSSNYDDTTDARKRFYALVNRNQAARGLPPIREPKPELPAAMQKFVHMKRNGETEAFIQQNEERIARGEPPIGCNGLPIQPEKAAPAPAPERDEVTEAFFADAKPPGAEGYANVRVRRFNT